jgi:ribonuclease G
MVFINDPVLADEVRNYIREIAPEKEKIVKVYHRTLPIFDYFGINKQIKALFGKTVSFKHGAYLIIEHTEALHVIYVNSGNRSRSGNDQEANALEVNMEAATEIARQLRLRDMGGIIVVDFMICSRRKQTASVRQNEEIMAGDKGLSIISFPEIRSMQITRQRVRPEMEIVTDEKCPSCHGPGQTGPILLPMTWKTGIHIDKIKTRSIILNVHPLWHHFKKGIIQLYRNGTSGIRSS